MSQNVTAFGCVSQAALHFIIMPQFGCRQSNLFHRRRYWHHPDTATAAQCHMKSLSLWQRNEINISKYLLLLFVLIFVCCVRGDCATRPSLPCHPSTPDRQLKNRPSAILQFWFVLRINDRIAPTSKDGSTSGSYRGLKKKDETFLFLFCFVRFAFYGPLIPSR